MAMEEDTEIENEDEWTYSGDTIWQTNDLDEALRYECVRMAMVMVPDAGGVVKLAGQMEHYIKNGATNLKVVD